MAAGYSGSAYHSPSSSYNAPSRVPAASLSHSASRVAQPGQPGQPVQRSNTRENQLAVLRRYETVLLVDDSASMVRIHDTHQTNSSNRNLNWNRRAHRCHSGAKLPKRSWALPKRPCSLMLTECMTLYTHAPPILPGLAEAM